MKTETCHMPSDSFTTGKVLKKPSAKPAPRNYQCAQPEASSELASMNSPSDPVLASKVFSGIVDTLRGGISTYNAVTFKLPVVSKGLIKAGERITAVNRS